jgi:hypothetical protein
MHARDLVACMRALIRKAPPRRDRLRINWVTREVIELTHGEAVKNGLSVQLEPADRLPPVRADRVHLRQVRSFLKRAPQPHPHRSSDYFGNLRADDVHSSIALFD